jgi:AcrR family transcriptional regulator
LSAARQPKAPPRRGRPTQGSADGTRRRVLDAARRAFSAQGYSGATMRGIASAAGLSTMALYNYAPSKAALFETVWRESIEIIYAGYEQAVAGRRSLLEEVEALLDRSLEVLTDDPDHIRFVMRLLIERQQPDLARADLEVSAYTDFIRQLVARSVARGEITRRERARLATFVTTLLWGITTLAAFDPTSLDRTVEAAKWAARHQLDPVVLEKSKRAT